MVDLQNQYLKIKEEIDLTVLETFKSADFIQGKKVELFQNELEEYLDVKHVITCANGTDALQIAMMALDLQKGDEIIVPCFTYIATAEVIALLGLTPIIVDVDFDTFLIDIEKVKKAITKNTKAIVPVHLFGQICNMDQLLEVAREHDLKIIEDTAQALGAKYKFDSGNVQRAGTIGDIGCTSFFPSKNLGCFGDGGAIFTNNSAIASKIKMIANHGQTKKYHHDIVGVNSRLDTVQAAILSVKLKYLDKYEAARQMVANYYTEKLSNIGWMKLPKRVPNSTHVFHQYTVILDDLIDRQSFKDYLQSHGIPTMIYYPIPLHKQKAFSNTNQSIEQFPISEKLCDRVISLPIHTELSIDQLEKIIDVICKYK